MRQGDAPLQKEIIMSQTPFPHGIRVYGIPIFAGAGDVYFVGATAGKNWSAGSNSLGNGTFQKPFATIDYAIGYCTASNDDIIYVLPGHTETVSAAGGITADIAGISIIGLGNGRLKPKITLSATASTIAVSAANVTFKNIEIVPGIADIVSVFYITAAGCTLDGLFCTTNSTYSIKSMVLTTAAGTQLTVCNCHLTQTVSPGATSIFFNLVGADHFRFFNNFTRITLSNHSTSCTIGGGTTLSANVEIFNNRIIQTGGTTQASSILMYTASTGVICDNRIFTGSTALAGGLNPANCYCAENYIENVVAKSGILDPVVTSDIRMKTGVVYL
jgi:hypothetical protein